MRNNIAWEPIRPPPAPSRSRAWLRLSRPPSDRVPLDNETDRAKRDLLPNNSSFRTTEPNRTDPNCRSKHLPNGLCCDHTGIAIMGGLRVLVVTNVSCSLETMAATVLAGSQTCLLHCCLCGCCTFKPQLTSMLRLPPIRQLVEGFDEFHSTAGTLLEALEWLPIAT